MLPTALVLVWAALALAADQREPKITVVSKNKAWIENLVLDPTSESLFFSELKFGNVWRVRGFANGTYAETLWLTGFESVLGLAHDPSQPGVLYGAGKLNGTNVIYKFSSLQATTHTVIATLPSGCLGNGFGLHEASGKLYTACEGTFAPGTGSVYEIEAVSGKVTPLTTSMWAADGLWIDQQRHLLYVGQLFSATVFVWSLAPQVSFVGVLKGFKGGFLDDFTLTDTNNTAIAGCDWTGNKIMRFNAVPTNGTITPTPIVSATIQRPTSARWGYDQARTAPFPAASLFVSEGRSRDYLLKTREDRLLRVDF
jgi:hypothetical protein